MPDQLPLLPTPPTAPPMRRDAALSPCGTWRYDLPRVWDPSLPLLLAMLTNPSKADEETDDPTTAKVVGYARRWGYGSTVILNPHAYRDKTPANLWAAADAGVDIVGPESDRHITTWAARASVCLVGWGSLGRKRDRLRLAARLERVLPLLAGVELVCLGANKDGSPVHPLYQPADARPVDWRAR